MYNLNYFIRYNEEQDCRRGISLTCAAAPALDCSTLYIEHVFFLLLTISPFLTHGIGSLGGGCLQHCGTGLLKSCRGILSDL